jgi:hypothetical protein
MTRAGLPRGHATLEPPRLDIPLRQLEFVLALDVEMKSL